MFCQHGHKLDEGKKSLSFVGKCVVGAAALVLVTVATIVGEATSDGPPPEKLTGKIFPVASSGNISHDKLSGFVPAIRAAALGQAVGCKGVGSFFMGLNPKDQEAYWSVTCSDGQSFEIAIQANATGTSSVADCDTMKAIGISCFVKLSEQ